MMICLLFQDLQLVTRSMKMVTLELDLLVLFSMTHVCGSFLANGLNNKDYAVNDDYNYDNDNAIVDAKKAETELDIFLEA